MTMTRRAGKAGAVWLKIEDCGDCPFCDEDEDYAVCEHHKAKGIHIAVYRRAYQVRIPPKNCPLRKPGSLKTEEVKA